MYVELWAGSGLSLLASSIVMTLDFSHRLCHQILITFTTKFWSGFDAVKGIDGTDGLRVGGMCFGGDARADH